MSTSLTNNMPRSSTGSSMVSRAPLISWFSRSQFLPVQVSQAAFLPVQQHGSSARGAASSHPNCKGTRVQPVDAARPPGMWSSDEAYFRTGTFGGPGVADSQPSDYGGTEVLRPLRRYHANAQTSDKLCVKHKPSTRKLGPGVMVRSASSTFVLRGPGLT